MKQKNLYKYIDHKTGRDGKVIFSVYAYSILEADKAYEEAMGHSILKATQIGCVSESVK